MLAKNSAGLSHRVFCSAVLRLYAWAKGMWEFRNALNGSLDWFRRFHGEQIWIPKDNSLTGLAFFSFYLLKPWHIHTFFTYLLVKTDSWCTSSWLVLVCREIEFFLLNCSSLHKIKYWLRSSSLQYGRTMQIQDLNFNIQSVLCNSCWHLSHSCLAVTVKDVMSHHCFYCVGMEVFCSLSGHCCVCQKRKWIQTGKLSVHILNAGELIYCLRTGLMKLTV